MTPKTPETRGVEGLHNLILSQVWRYMLVTPVLRRLRQEGTVNLKLCNKSQASLGYME